LAKTLKLNKLKQLNKLYEFRIIKKTSIANYLSIH
jgi:hypothetical protein